MTARPEYLERMQGDDNTAENAALWLVLEITCGSNKNDAEIEQVAIALLRHAETERDYDTGYFAYLSALLAALIGNRKLFMTAARAHAKRGPRSGESAAIMILRQMLDRQEP